MNVSSPINNQKIFLTCLTLLYLHFASCREDTNVKFRYLQPEYKQLQLLPTNDTIHFLLDDNTYNNIRSFNYFSCNEKEYIVFYDKQSLSICLYNFKTRELVRKISLKKCLPGKKLERKTTIFFKNLDSFFVINNLTLYLLDGLCNLKDSVSFQENPILAFSSFEKKNPPIFLGNVMYTVAKPNLSTNKFREIKKWRSLYQLDFKKKNVHLLYRLPDTYKKNKYNFLFFDNSYCFNDKGRFVFSFAADTNIYETDLASYNVGYFGKSRFQTGDIRALTETELKSDNEIAKAFLIRDSYDAIYFDPFHKRYLRIAKQKIGEKEYRKRKQKETSVIFFDQNFRIVGESKFDDSIDISYFFFTKNGQMYAKLKSQDENALHFVRLIYKEGTELAKLK